MTNEELDAIEARAREYERHYMDRVWDLARTWNASDDARALVAEVRRLRAALIDIRDNARWESEVDERVAAALGSDEAER